MPPWPSFSMISYSLPMTNPGARSSTDFSDVLVGAGRACGTSRNEVAQLLQYLAVSVFSAWHLGQVVDKPGPLFLRAQTYQRRRSKVKSAGAGEESAYRSIAPISP